MSTPARRAARRAAARVGGLSVGQLLGVTIGVLLLFAAAGIGLALQASSRLSHQRSVLLDQVGPTNRTALELENALVNEETGIRGYLITAEPSFLAPYHAGLRAEDAAYAEIEGKERIVGEPVAVQIASVRAAAEAWRTGFVARAVAHPRQVFAGATNPDAGGKTLFDAIRVQLRKLKTTLTEKDNEARTKLDSAASELQTLLILAAALVVGSVLGAGLLLRATVTQPLAELGEEARRVSGGDFEAPLQSTGGPREVVAMAAEMETMRERIVQELGLVREAQLKLEEQALELTRSNADLEQFAYVASHDLQEPLRKVTSFCQALAKRYEGQLDERADQYIEFAVDGAKRMQVLINDLLAFSRVGRGGRERETVSLTQIVADAQGALAGALEGTGGRVESQQLPSVRGDAALLRSLLQNLIGNALKFHGEQPPAVHIDAVRDGGFWQISVSDNGIGIEPEYAERIFLIFQRLHARDAYGGTGIGLALCRKIVEYHGGRIWLDTGLSQGARFRFTLPVLEEAQ